MAPDILGTIPQWLTGGAVVTFIGLLVRRDVQVRGLNNADTADRRDHIAEEMKALRENVARLRDELHNCEEDCRVQIKTLTDEVWGEKRQRVAEQLSLINIILDSVDAPELQTLRATLENIQSGMKR